MNEETTTVVTDTEKQSWKSELKSCLIVFVIALLIGFVTRSFIILNAVVPTGSMENTILPGDNIIGNRLAYLKADPERGDIVTFVAPDDNSQLYTKRIIGLPGETLTIEDGKIYINGSSQPLEEDYLKEEWTVANGPFTFEIPDNCYFMMGDNRNNSYDARYWENTYVTRDEIVAKMVLRYRSQGKLNFHIYK